MFAVRGEVVIDARYEHIVVELGGGTENVTGIIQPVSGGRIVGRRLTGAESPVKITSVISQVEHCRINPNALRVEILQSCAIERGDSAVHVSVPKDALTERRRRNHAFGALLLALAGPLVVHKEKQPVFLNRPANRRAEDIAV